MLLRRGPRTPPRLLTLVTRQGCTLCQEAEPVVTRAADRAGIAYEVRDVDAEPGLAQWSDSVPVVLLDGVPHAYWQIEEKALRAALKG